MSGVLVSVERRPSVKRVGGKALFTKVGRALMIGSGS
jgi:hypothetical protein